MRSILHFIFIFVFAGLLFGQSPSDISTDDNRIDQHRSIRDRMSKFKRDQTHNASRNGLNRYTQSSKPMHKATGSGVDTAWVRHYGSSLAQNDDWAEDVAVDHFGTVYVTGSSGTVAYDSNGVQKWHRKSRGYKIEIDNNGSIYVAGYIYDNIASNDFLLIKYNANGDSLWTRQYNGAGNSYDYLYAMTIDRNGNIYITGLSNSMIATLKYNTNGDMLWMKRHNSSGSSNEYPIDIVVDANGYAYVIGVSHISNINSDYVTIKYDINGDTLWTRQFNGPYSNTDYASTLAVDEQGNVLVTGSCMNINTDFDFATIKYNPSGDLVWVRYYGQTTGADDDARTIVTDSAGNIYVSGMSQSTIGYRYNPYYLTTVKYNTNGDTLWIKHNGVVTYDDSYIKSFINIGSHLIVAGTSSGREPADNIKIISYTLDGDTLWSKQISEHIHAIAIDETGNIYVAGVGLDKFSLLTYPHLDYLTAKYNANGDSLWNRSFSTTYSIDDARSLAVRKNGDIYLVGTSYRDQDIDNFLGGDITTVKYNNSGNLLWSQRYNGPKNSEDGANSVHIDNDGNVFVAGSIDGSIYGPGGGRFHGGEYAIFKYDTNGDTLWIRRYNGSDNGENQITSSAIDNQGNLYVTGISSTITSYADFATIKYNSNGDSLWLRRYNGPANYSDWARSLAIDGSGNVYVAGASYGSGNSSNYTTIKYHSNGDTLWVRRYNEPGNSNNTENSLAVDGSGNVYMTGTSYSSGTYYDYITIKYNSNGETLWVRKYNGPGDSYDYARSLAVDESGSVYVTGASVGSNTNYDYATIKYNSNGDTVWVRRYHGKGHSTPTSLVVDINGNLYVTGHSDGNIVTIKYNSEGSEEWIAHYSNGWPEEIRIDSHNNVYVAGTLYDNYGTKFLLIKYIQGPTTVNNTALNIPTTFSLQQNYPNPFNPSTTIRYALPFSSHVKLTIHDILGREVATLVNEEQSAGWKEVEWNARNFASGMYLAKMFTRNPFGEQSGNFIETKKILLMK